MALRQCIPTSSSYTRSFHCWCLPAACHSSSLVVSDQHCLRRVASDGFVTTIAGAWVTASWMYARAVQLSVVRRCSSVALETTWAAL